MRTSRFPEEHIALALRQAEAGTPVAEVCRKLKQLAADLSLDKVILQENLPKKIPRPAEWRRLSGLRPDQVAATRRRIRQASASSSTEKRRA